MALTLVFLLIICIFLGYFLGKARARFFRKKNLLPSPIHYYGYFYALCFFLICSPVFFMGYIYFASSFSPFSQNAVLLYTAGAFIPFVIGLYLIRRLTISFNPRKPLERLLKALLALSLIFTLALSASILFSLLLETFSFFRTVPFFSFFFGLHWSPQLAPHAPAEAFGFIPLLLGTFLITCIALLFSIPLGIFAAIYLSEIASSRKRKILKPLLEMLAGIPSVVYGFFAVMVVIPWLQTGSHCLGITISSQSALGVGLVLGIMLLPYISSLCDDVFRSVPNALRDASLGLGSTRAEAICRVVIPAAFPGIMASILLALSRAMGETMLVVMAAGLSATLTLNPLNSVTTITVQIITLLTGDQEFGSPQTLGAFALGFMLFGMTFLINMGAQMIVRRFEEKYD